ncbi:hypothetical protein HN51_028408, partial [Arachis hypogaea]
RVLSPLTGQNVGAVALFSSLNSSHFSSFLFSSPSHKGSVDPVASPLRRLLSQLSSHFLSSVAVTSDSSITVIYLPSSLP